MISPVSCPTPPQKLSGVEEYSTSPEAAPWTIAFAVTLMLTTGGVQVDVAERNSHFSLHLQLLQLATLVLLSVSTAADNRVPTKRPCPSFISKK